ncbi:MAG: glycosyl transferase family 2 [Solirubrobacterales bacterium]|nr:glycosyl transferase family 2 [Solirubrobacterales bacterium]
MREPGGHETPITAVVITRDRCRVLVRSLERLTALPGRPRVIVVDNGSSDDTVRIVRERFPTVDLIALERNRGASARNVGVSAAQTPYVAFSDDDSWWAEGALQRAAELLDANPRLALIAAMILVGASERLDPTCALMADSPLRHPPGLPGHPVLGFLACGAVVRRSAFEAVGGFQLRQGVGGEEQLLAVDLAEAGHDLAYVPEVCAHHHPPQPGGDGGSRRSETMRNDLWFAWLRRSLGSSIAQTGSLAASALFDAHARAALTGAIRGAPPVLAARRPVKRELELQLRLLDRAAREP